MSRPMHCSLCGAEATKEAPVGDCMLLDQRHCENCCKQMGHRRFGVHRWKPIHE